MSTDSATTSKPAPPSWLVDEFNRRGLDAPVFIRSGSAVVWRDADASMIAKMYTGPTAVQRCHAEQTLARLGRNAGVSTPCPLGIAEGSSDQGDWAVGWWEHLTVLPGGVSSIAVVQVLRTLHDATATTQRLPLPTLPLVPLVGRADDRLATEVEPLVRRANAWLTQMQDALPPVVLHGDPNPTNTLMSPDGPALIDWGRGGLGPRVWDVAVVAQLAAECSTSQDAATRAVADVFSRYGPHPEVTAASLEKTMEVVAIDRLVACTHQPGWAEEGRARFAALQQGVGYRFPVGFGPK